MRVIYVAGPFRAKTAWEIECNVRRVEEYGLAIAKMGAMPVMVHANNRFFHGICDEQFWLDAVLELLTRCDAAFFIPDWQRSSGSRTEWDWCKEHGTAAFEDLHKLKVWIDSPFT